MTDADDVAGSEARLSEARSRLCVALDTPDLGRAIELADAVSAFAGVLKIGLELFTHGGPQAVAELRSRADVFLDLKLHDIPETVARAVGRAADLGVSLLTVHACGGRAMLERAARAAEGGPRLLAITVLTSMSDDDLRPVGVTRPLREHAMALAELASRAGIGGFVCSAHETPALRERFPGALLVTPGIRGPNDQADDQKRIASPRDAIRGGSSLLVVGRPIRDAADPAQAAREIRDSIARALEERR